MKQTTPYWDKTSNPDGYAYFGFPFQVTSAQRLQAFFSDQQNRIETYKRWLISKGMPREDADAYLWRMSGLSNMSLPDSVGKMQDYIAEDWLRRHTNKLYGQPPSQNYLEYHRSMTDDLLEFQYTKAKKIMSDDKYDRLVQHLKTSHPDWSESRIYATANKVAYKKSFGVSDKVAEILNNLKQRCSGLSSTEAAFKLIKK